MVPGRNQIPLKNANNQTKGDMNGESQTIVITRDNARQ